MQVVIIDDEPTITVIVSKMISVLGHESVSFNDEFEAVDYLSGLSRENRIDLILLDMKLKHVSGKEIFKKIREVNPKQEIVAITGYGLSDDVKELLNSGMKTYLKKPFGFTEIKELLCNLSA